MNLNNRLDKLEQQARPQTDISFQNVPIHTHEDSVSIICQLFDLGVLPENPPTHWTPEQLGGAKGIKALPTNTRKRTHEY